MARSTKPSLQTGKASSDLLEAWGNDDLLLNERAQRAVAESSPDAFRVLDWANLRTEFTRHEETAKLAKKRINRHGSEGALLTATGASSLSLAPLIAAGVFQSAAIVTGCALVVIGGSMGLWHLLGHRGRTVWLQERLWTERLRQFYFQYLLNNFGAATTAMTDDAELHRYQSLRDGALLVFVDQLQKNISGRAPVEAINWLAEDHDDTQAWCQSTWQVNRLPYDIPMTDMHREILECLARSRIGIQEIYARANLKRGQPTQGERAWRVNFFGNVATLAFVALLLLAGMSVLVTDGRGMLSSEMSIALSGIAAAWGLYFRLIDQGMGYSFDVERYKLYAEQVELVRQRFNGAEDNVFSRIVALRQLEIYAYREMRQFLRTHLRSRFLG